MAIEWRRVPPTLILSFAVDALRLVVANLLSPSDRNAWSIVLALDVIGPTLAGFGYLQLARQLAGRAKLGATLAAGASVMFVALVLAAQFSRSWWLLPPFVPIAVGVGLAVIVPRRWFALAVPAIALPIAAVVVRDFYAVWDVASIATTLAIVVVASSAVTTVSRSVAAASSTVVAASSKEAGPAPPRPGRRLAIASGVLFAVSLCLPAVAITDKPLFGGGEHDRYLWGIQCLLAGWIVIPGWVANPLALAAAILHACRKDRVAFPLACIAVGSAVVAPFAIGWFVKMRHPEIGYAAWLASMVCLAVATRRANKNQVRPN